MFLKARQCLRMMLLALATQIGALAKVGIRKGYRYKNGNHGQLRQAKDGFKPGLEARLNGPSGFPSDDDSKYQLGLTGKFEPASNLPIVDLFGNSNPGQLQPASRCGGCPSKVTIFRLSIPGR